MFGVEKFFGVKKIFWIKKIWDEKKVFGQKIYLVEIFFWVNNVFRVEKLVCWKKLLGQKYFLVKKCLDQNFFWVVNIFGSIFFYFCSQNFCLERVNPPPRKKNSRVKIVLGCCYFCWVRSPTKFQTPRIILSGRSRVPVGGVGGVKW